MPLSTHVLDISRGAPAAGVGVRLCRIDGGDSKEIASARTDGDGRVASPFGGDLSAGTYELIFAAGAYFAQSETRSFYDQIPIRFQIDDLGARYHVPLLLSPWGYSTYRGS